MVLFHSCSVEKEIEMESIFDNSVIHMLRDILNARRKNKRRMA